MTVPLTSFRFEVILDLDTPTDGLASPLCDAAFSECDGLEMTMEPKVVDSAGVTDRQQRLIGPIKYGQVTLKRGMTSNLQLWQWFAQGVRPGSVLTAHGQITMWSETGDPALQFILEGCLPVKMRAPSLNAATGAIAVEELALVCEKVSISLPGGSGFGLTAGFTAGFGAGVSGGAGVSVGASASVSVGATADAGFSIGGGL